MEVKIVMIGQSGVGKSSILECYTKNSFSETMEPTFAPKYKRKYFDIDDQQVKVEIFDLSGNEKFQSINTAYIPGMQGVIIVFDVSKQIPKDFIEFWINLSKEKKDKSGQEIVLVGNKNDLNQLISIEEAEKLATEHGLHYFDVSAKNGDNINEVFTYIVTQIYNFNRRQTNKNDFK